jgi:hypothetical protein
MLPTIAPEQLDLVAAGIAYSDADLGRCGPGSSWKWLGNIHTSACMQHDLAVRGALQSGSSHVMAQVKALPLLPAAVGSWVSAKLHGQ